MIRSFKNVLTSALVIGLMFSVVTAEAKAKKSTKKPAAPVKKEEVKVAPVVQDTFLVEFKGSKISKRDLDSRIDKIPPMYKTRYKSVEGQKQVLDMLVQEEVFYLEALERGVPEKQSVKDAIKSGLRPIYNEKYYEKEVASKVKITDANLKAFYEETKGKYITPPSSTIRHLQVKSDSLALVVSEAIKAGKNFKDLIRLYSDNKTSKSKDGIIENIRHNKYIPGIGKDQELDEFIFLAKVDTVNVLGPFPTRSETPEYATHFFQKIDFKNETIKPYEEVKADVESGYKFNEENKIYNSIITSLKTKYAISIDREFIEKTDLLQLRPESFDKVVVNSNNPDLVITAQQAKEIIKNKYQMERANVQDPKIRYSAIDKDVESRLIYADALLKDYDKQLENDVDVIQFKRGAYLRELYSSEVVAKTVVTEQDKKDYYDKNVKAYTQPVHKDIRQFVFDNEKEALKIQKKVAKLVLKNKEDKIIELLKKTSKAPEKDGLIESIYNNGYIPGQDNEKEYCNLVFATKTGETSKVFKNSKDQFVFFYIVKDYPEKVASYEEKKESIEANTKRVKTNERLAQVTADLKAKHVVKENYEAITQKITVEEYFTLAENAQKQNNYPEAVFYYDQIIKSFPNGKDDYKAWFMKAFIYSEDLKDNNKAITLYEELLKKWPEGELNESAKFMLEALKGNNNPEEMIKD
jgi:peptidyl-prolyl cis-trans isomerase C